MEWMQQKPQLFDYIWFWWHNQNIYPWYLWWQYVCGLIPAHEKMLEGISDSPKNDCFLPEEKHRTCQLCLSFKRPLFLFISYFKITHVFFFSLIWYITELESMLLDEGLINIQLEVSVFLLKLPKFDLIGLVILNNMFWPADKALSSLSGQAKSLSCQGLRGTKAKEWRKERTKGAKMKPCEIRCGNPSQYEAVRERTVTGMLWAVTFLERLSQSYIRMCGQNTKGIKSH